MIRKIKCLIGVHDYVSRAKDDLDIELFRENPTQFFVKHTYLVCRECNKEFQCDNILTSKKDD